MIYCKILHDEILQRLEDQINEWLGATANNSNFFEVRDVTFTSHDGFYSCMVFYNVHLEKESILK